MGSYPPGDQTLVAEFRQLQIITPSLRHDIINTLMLMGGKNFTLSLEDLKAGYFELFCRPFPAGGDPIFIRDCMMTIPGIAATADGLWYSYMLDG